MKTTSHVFISIENSSLAMHNIRSFLLSFQFLCLYFMLFFYVIFCIVGPLTFVTFFFVRETFHRIIPITCFDVGVFNIKKIIQRMLITYFSADLIHVTFLLLGLNWSVFWPIKVSLELKWMVAPILCLVTNTIYLLI